jgi:peptidyl-tRNA hydrolase
MVKPIIIKVFIVRKDLKMSPGKVASQVGHAGRYFLKQLLIYLNSHPILTIWNFLFGKLTVVQVKSFLV